MRFASPIREFAPGVQQHDNHLALGELRLQHQAAAGVVGKAGLRQADVPVPVRHQPVGVVVRERSSANIEIVSRRGRIAADKIILMRGAHQFGQILGARHVGTGEAGGVVKVRTVHAQHLRLVIHGALERVDAARIGAPQGGRGAVLRGHQGHAQQLVAAQIDARFQARVRAAQRIHVFARNGDGFIQIEAGVRTTIAVISLVIEAMGDTRLYSCRRESRRFPGPDAEAAAECSDRLCPT
jgi:hypothetical protein